MITIFISLVISILLWMGFNAIAFYFTEVWEIPYKVKFIDFKPFNCCICCTFWSNILSNLVLTLSTNFNYLYASILWLILTILTAISMKVNERKNTIDLSEIDKIIEEKKRNYNNENNKEW